MNKIEENRKNRQQFLILLYEKTNQNIHENVDYRDISQELGLNEDEGWNIFEYLKDKYWAKARTLGGGISITTPGIEQAENLLSKSGVDSSDSRQVINFINVTSMYNSQISQGSVSSNQTLNLTQEQSKNLAKFVELFEQRFSELPFISEDDKKEAVAEVQIIKTQLESPRPKMPIIYESGKSLKNILEGMTGSLIASELLKYLLGF